MVTCPAIAIPVRALPCPRHLLVSGSLMYLFLMALEWFQWSQTCFCSCTRSVGVEPPAVPPRCPLGSSCHLGAAGGAGAARTLEHHWHQPGLSWDRADGASTGCPQCVPTHAPQHRPPHTHTPSAVTKGLGRNLHSKHFLLLSLAHPLHPESQLTPSPAASRAWPAAGRTPVVTNPPGSCTESGLPLRGKVSKKKIPQTPK